MQVATSAIVSILELHSRAEKQLKRSRVRNRCRSGREVVSSHEQQRTLELTERAEDLDQRGLQEAKEADRIVLAPWLQDQMLQLACVHQVRVQQLVAALDATQVQH